jgi:hypothetical protein
MFYPATAKQKVAAAIDNTDNRGAGLVPICKNDEQNKVITHIVGNRQSKKLKLDKSVKQHKRPKM